MARDYTELPTTSDGRTLGAWGRIDLVHQLSIGKCAKAVLIRVTRNESLRDGCSKEAVSTIAGMTGFSRRAVGQAITGLVKGDFLIELRRGTGRAPWLQVNWERVQRMAEQGDEETCSDSAQVEEIGEPTCEETTQVEAETCAEDDQVARTCADSAQVVQIEKGDPRTCAKSNGNLRSFEPEPAQKQHATCADFAHKGFEGSIEGVSHDEIVLDSSQSSPVPAASARNHCQGTPRVVP